MLIKKFCAILLSAVMMLPAETQPIPQPVETQPQTIQTEPLQTEIPDPTFIATLPVTQPTELIPSEPQQQITEPTSEVTDPPPTTMVQPTEVEEKTQEQLLLASETEPVPDAGLREDDLGTVSGQGISFRLFNYSSAINKSAGNTAWRPISSYFTFRNSKIEAGTDASAFQIPDPNSNAAHDQDGFTKYHATVERILDGYPVLDLSRNADGSLRTDPNVARSVRSLAYLFSGGDHAVTAYTPANTILQQSGSHYWYNSAAHAVDYDSSANRFRLRSYVERNSTTAGYGTAYGDFLPFTYTGGIAKDTTDEGAPYHVNSEDTDYWFGMTMQVNFFQTKNGKLADQDMIFRFSGDDDVWVFVDDVLLLDLGGTHGTANGSINFSTGEILQYLTWSGANASEAERTGGSDTSFPTSIRACFDAAGKVPNGGWSSDGRTFEDFTEHTLKFFYLERGAAVANCSLDFRLPTLPDESLTVTKDLTASADTQLRDYITDTLDYCFRVMKADSAGNPTGEPFITSGMTYELLENGSKVGTGTVEEDHTFRLKAGQSAQFTQMLHKGNGATRYVVEEIMPDELTGQYAGIEYLLSGAGGDTVTENYPAEAFTAFRTGLLTAEQTQIVTFRNRVDTARLGTLKLTKLAAPGTLIPPELLFKMQVSLGGILLPVGTGYRVAEELRTVETAGEIFLRAGETAVIEQGILSGTAYRVTELSAALDGYRPTYTGTVEPSSELSCTQDGVSGVFPLNGTVHVTITNADYDFAVQLPIRKKVLDFRQQSVFSFGIEQVQQSDTGWQTVNTLPDQTILITNSETAETLLTIGYRSNTEGTFYYRITERIGDDGYLYDTSTFLMEVTVSNGAAEIAGIYRDGEETEQVLFVNRAVTSLTVTKTVSGAVTSEEFPFTAEVFLHGEAFLLPCPDESSGYTVEGNVLTFSLGHGESIMLPCIPIGALVKVKEHSEEGFLVYHKLEAADEMPISASYREIQFTDTPQTIHFTNQSGFRLPNTGGTGTLWHTAGGAAITSAMSAALLYRRSRRERRKRNPPKE